jgi:hypothetical protein
MSARTEDYLSELAAVPDEAVQPVNSMILLRRLWVLEQRVARLTREAKAREKDNEALWEKVKELDHRI